MREFLTLEALGPRIFIMGPSNSGKSTLAMAISRKKILPAIHLDQLYHLPGSKWIPRDNEEFLSLHKDAISQEHWVIEGNYRKCFAERSAHATGFILLDLSTALSLFRYVRRCSSSNLREGGLNPGKDHVSLDMIKHILFVTRSNRKIYKDLYEQSTLPKMHLKTARDLNICYEKWRL